ncbi:MAG: NBR1-Ig-like domain-containing protein [Anaerolineales bacterium]
MKSRAILISLILVVGAFLFSCANNQADQTTALDTDSIRTQAVETYASNLTQLAPTSTAFPTLTPVGITATALSLTPEPSPTSNPCFNLLYISDVTIPDGTRMKPGEKFTKTWLVQNIGGCAWRAGFTFQNVGGDSMRGSPITLTEAIPTGAKRELSVELVVPSGINGVIESAWQMADDTGVFFGDTLFVNIVVGDVITPAVTSTP